MKSKIIKMFFIAIIGIIIGTTNEKVLAIEAEGGYTAEVTYSLSQLDSEDVDPDEYTPDILPEDSIVTSAAGKIVGAIRMVGVIISVLILVIIGIKYMLASPSGKADFKEQAIPYLIGAVLLFSGTSLVQIIYDTMH